jgi:molybdopterin converting factor subunit 1
MDKETSAFGYDDHAMTVKTLFFAHYQDIVGVREQSISLASPATVRRLADELQQRYPGLGDLLAQSRVAVNAEFADADTALQADDEIAWMPPMSGGC